ncbi:MAG: translation initiation factor IF-3 [Nitrospirae bacterium]|nr:translation initiation factor IF-3 [Nitrospirota bacterium]
MRIAGKKTRVNREIQAKEVRVIDANGAQIGVLPIAEAMQRAAEAALDLVEVAPTATPPVCRIIDFGKYKYEQSKRQHQSRLHQKVTLVKEVKLRPRTGKHDLDFKARHIRNFLEEGHKVKVTVMFRGREMAYPNKGKILLDHLAEEFQGAAKVEQPPRLEGNNMSMILVAVAKK